MASKNAKRSSKKDNAKSTEGPSSKTEQFEQYFGIAGKKTRSDVGGVGKKKRRETFCNSQTNMASRYLPALKGTSKSPIAKRSRSSTNSAAARLIKRMEENKRDLCSNNTIDDFHGQTENLPDTLDELDSNDRTIDDRQQRKKTAENRHELDVLLESETAKRIQADNEVTIQFCSPLHADVGTTEQVFCINDLSQLKRMLSSSPHCRWISPLLLPFLCCSHSRLRCTLFERLRRKAFLNGGQIAVPFADFLCTLCYAFQTSPLFLQFFEAASSDNQMHSVGQVMDSIDTLFAPSKVHQSKQRHCLRYANIERLLVMCCYLRFDHWTDPQLVTLGRALCRIYLDRGAREFRAQLARTFQMIFLPSPSSHRFRTVLANVLASSPSSVNYCIRSAFAVFQMFTHLDHCEQSLRLFALQSALKAIISQNGGSEKTETPTLVPPNCLGDALDCLPRAVSVVRRSSTQEELGQTSSFSVLYLLCNRWPDTLTADERRLFDRRETVASLERALQSIRQANEQLNRRNINDKMIHTWAQSEHRIRAALIHRQRGKLRLTMSSVETPKSSKDSTNKFPTFIGSSSEDDDDSVVNK